MCVGLIALVTAVLLIALARTIGLCWQFVHHRVQALVPQRVSYVVTTALVVLAVFLIANRVVARLALRAADSIFLEIDKVVEDELPAPTLATASGGPDSLVPWDTIGRRGKTFILSGPTEQDIADFRGQPAKQPLRVYAGMRSRDSLEERAKLALEELKRVGGFERSLLVVAVPTGTGWLDPGAVDSLEYLHGGDTAIVSMQYSYLPSWITIMVDPRRSLEAGQVLFDTVYNHWTSLPKDRRPKLYLHGLSLGALGSAASADLFTVFEDPIQGAVWSGPPFPSTVWSNAVRGRNPGTPVWLPTFRDSSMVRFTGRENVLPMGGRRWGPMRLVYIQHASDPMSFFSTDLLYRRPEWLVGERGPDVSPYLSWWPLLTFLQVAFDLPLATSVPHGYGHNFAAASYIDAWIAVTAPAGWKDSDVARLKERLREE
ncbi:MAG: alpha/beta-hydrolase family protein [Pirellulales bacterium]